jgi:LysR family glycine cleavage system transcriptional activator
MDSRPLPSLAALRAFCAVADSGGFGRAADRLGSTQTAVSHQIAQLEGWIGSSLFDRGRTGAVLTPRGARLHPVVSETLLRLEEALRAARADSGRQTIALAVTPEFSSQWLAPRLAGFLQQFPDIELMQTVGYRLPDFADGRTDLAIRLGDGGPGLVSEALTADDEFAVCTPDLAAILPPRRGLLAAPCLTYDGVRHTVLDWRRWLEQVVAEPFVLDASYEELIAAARSFPTFADMLAACRRGEGFALVRTSLVAADLANRTLVRAFNEVQSSPFNYNLVYPKAALANPAVARFRDWIVDQALSASTGDWR